MRHLFTIDLKDYDPLGEAFIRPSVRGILIGNGKTDQIMLEREALVLEKLLEEGCFSLSL